MLIFKNSTALRNKLVNMESSIGSVDRNSTETVHCKICEAETRVCLSKTTTNLGKLYHGCPFHGWQKWVGAEGGNGGRNSSFTDLLARGEFRRRGLESVPEGLSLDARIPNNVNGFFCNCRGGVSAFTVLNAMLFGANVLGLCIYLLSRA